MRLRLTITYVGTAYAGWQVQPDAPTVQATIERAVAAVDGGGARVVAASRTDAGVHAAGQVCHFDAARELGSAGWQRALNGLLPADIRVVELGPVAADFHARHDARRKTYRYHLDPASVASPFLAPFAWHQPRLRHPDRMRQAAALLVGPLDQRPFASRPEVRGRPVRPVDACDVELDRLVTITVAGRSFLRHAVRGMVGTLVQIGTGQRRLAELEALLGGDAGARAGPIAPPHGLCLAAVDYPS